MVRGRLSQTRGFARRTAGGRCIKVETEALRRVLVDVLAKLPDREREIIVATKVVDHPATRAMPEFG
jgi:DNA-directed RNA polymerase specialized sigma subunit